MMQSKKVTVAQNDVISTHCYMFSLYQLPVELLPSVLCPPTAHCPVPTARAAATPPLLQPPTLLLIHDIAITKKMWHGYYTPPCVLARFV